MASCFRYYQLPMPLPDESSKPVFFFGLFEFLKLKIPRSDVHLTSSVVIRGNPGDNWPLLRGIGTLTKSTGYPH